MPQGDRAVAMHAHQLVGVVLMHVNHDAFVIRHPHDAAWNSLRLRTSSGKHAAANDK